MVCKNCGADIEEKWEFCPSCGTKLEKDEECFTEITVDIPDAAKPAAETAVKSPSLLSRIACMSTNVKIYIGVLLVLTVIIAIEAAIYASPKNCLVGTWVSSGASYSYTFEFNLNGNCTLTTEYFKYNVIDVKSGQYNIVNDNTVAFTWSSGSQELMTFTKDGKNLVLTDDDGDSQWFKKIVNSF